MKTDLSAIQAAYNKVTSTHTYKYRKRLCNAVLFELFFSGYTDIDEILIHAYIDSLFIEENDMEINKDNWSAALIGVTGYTECYTKDKHLYICKKEDYLKDSKNHEYICKKAIMEITESKDKLYRLLNCDNLVREYTTANCDMKNNFYLKFFSTKQLIHALALYIYLDRKDNNSFKK